MVLLKGADSAVPQPGLYTGKEIWGWYVAGDTPHVWTHPEVFELGLHGVKATLPIVVPPQQVAWWLLNDGYATLEALIRSALSWGLPAGSPLVLDVEEGQSEKLPTNTAHAWAVACGVHGLHPWLYSGAGYLAKDQWCNKWLADWPSSTLTDPQMPPRMLGWQYAGNANGGRIDLDIFESGHTYLSPDLWPETV